MWILKKRFNYPSIDQLKMELVIKDVAFTEEDLNKLVDIVAYSITAKSEKQKECKESMDRLESFAEISPKEKEIISYWQGRIDEYKKQIEEENELLGKLVRLGFKIQ